MKRAVAGLVRLLVLEHRARRGGASFRRILALHYLEHAEWRERQARELLALAFMPGGIARLLAMRDALVAECDRLAGVFRRAADNRSA